MNDFDLFALFRKVQHPQDLDLAELRQMLQGMTDLTDRPWHHRLPFLAFLPPLLALDTLGAQARRAAASLPVEDQAALARAVQAAAVRLLAGARGRQAWVSLVRLLDDEEAEVRRAAVETLRISAAYDPGRWVHAALHPREDVRAAARTVGPPGPPPPLLHAATQAVLPALKDPTKRGKPRRIRKPNFAEMEVADLIELVLDGGAEPALLEAVLQRAAPGDLEPLLTYPLQPGWADLLEVYLDRHPGLDEDHRGRIAAVLFTRSTDKDRYFLPMLQCGPHWRSEVVKAFAQMGSEWVEHAGRSIVISGSTYHEELLAEALRQFSTLPQKLGPCLLESANKNLRYQAGRALGNRSGDHPLLHRLAETFVWGVETARYHTHEDYEVRMILGEHKLGYTRLNERRLYVSPRPLVLGERHGEGVVRGLILHELGHHLYHKGPEAERVHDQAEKEGLARLLNLVSDEHLERNLRQVDGAYGDLLKQLNAYAFQHSNREVEVRQLLEKLGDRAAKVLPKVRLEPARKAGHVAVASGKLLRELADGGVSFVRFMRALRMGLGNREGDPKVGEALALFRGDFRKTDMPGLLEIARRLRDIFGAETDLLDTVGSEGGLELDQEAWEQAGGGFNPDMLQQEVQRLLERKKEQDSGEEGGGGTGLNLSPEEAFEKLRIVSKLDHDPAAHAQWARRIAPAVRTLWRFFEDLGFTWQPQPRRLQGYRFDRTRARALVVQRDPRVLLARARRSRTDLFVGVAIDCSGSMAGPNLDKAKAFGTLLAEALKGLPGVDLRLFGFDDRVLYDAGDARRCAVHALRPTWGNNDAGGLFHLWKLARRSKRQAKLLLMISDGLPSACSVAALRGLVRELSRRGCCCAQVAVAPLSEICFPHYVLLDQQDLHASVRKFGTVVVRLVRRILG